MSLTFHNKRRREAAKKAAEAVKKPKATTNTAEVKKPVKKAATK